jgi:hypothetical protein
MRMPDLGPCNGDTFAASLAAELTSAAYPVALRRGLEGSWLELELGLWRALAGTVEKCARECRRGGPPGVVDGRREAFLRELTASAFSVALKHGVKGPLPEVERGLNQVFRSLLGRVGQAYRRLQVMRESH